MTRPDSDGPFADWLDRVHGALDERAPSVAPSGLRRVIAGRTPFEMADAARSRSLRAGALTAAAVLVGLMLLARAPATESPASESVVSARLLAADDAQAVEEMPLAQLAAPPLVLDAELERTNEVALLTEVVFGDIR